MPLSNPAERIAGPGFIAALDQSGGSTPKALKLYGIPEKAWQNEQQMFELVHGMRQRIITCPAFDERISGAILFERTMKDTIDGTPTPQYLRGKNIVPFLKVDKGLMPEQDNVQLMKEIPELDATLKDAVERGVFGTKMRSVINDGNAKGIQVIVDQQFAVAQDIMRAGLMPIIEPEINIKAPDKARAEQLLRDQVQRYLDHLPEDQQVMLKLTLPEKPNFYKALIEHPAVLRVVALSGGYSRDDANERLAQNSGMSASFSRALTEGLHVDQTDEEFTAILNAAIQSIYDAANT